MLDVFFQTKFRQDYKRCKKRGKDIKKFDALLKILVADEELPEEYQDHPLIGNYKGFRECHIEPNWLLIYEKTETTVYFVRLGTHSDLFKNK